MTFLLLLDYLINIEFRATEIELQQKYLTAFAS
ncbi:hypothetical protein E5S67_04041 [Microcoleus sp. IPMA8]|uniref:Uncharacterized protein n=1 Tax=Microcoleus asticus IPMA8 TaxID=2563858 RepID=A0ABX2D1D7_9CYAN|nr:hypothetical protein [Microcoleus asticus IPMA8]